MFTMLCLTIAIVAVCVVIHYEMLMRLSPFIHALPISRRQIVVIGVMLALTAHVLEIIVFAGGYVYVLDQPSLGYFTGEAPMDDFYDCLYLSFVTYSTLGFGDIVPNGWVRFLVGTEAITGLVQIAWTASYLYMEIREGGRD